jgi:putative transposase
MSPRTHPAPRPRRSARLEGWKAGRLEGWKAGRLEGWKAGICTDEGARRQRGFTPHRSSFVSTGPLPAPAFALATIAVGRHKRAQRCCCRISPANHSRVEHALTIAAFFERPCRRPEECCPLLSGPPTMTVWIEEGTTNAFEEAQARGDHREAARWRLCWVRAAPLPRHAGASRSASRPRPSPGRLYYRWRKGYGGLKTDQARRMKDVEKENLRLRRAISDLTLDKLILQEAARGNF